MIFKHLQSLTDILSGQFISFHCICTIATKGIPVHIFGTSHAFHVLLVVCSYSKETDGFFFNIVVLGLLQYPDLIRFNYTYCLITCTDLVGVLLKYSGNSGNSGNSGRLSRLLQEYYQGATQKVLLLQLQIITGLARVKQKATRVTYDLARVTRYGNSGQLG